MFFLLTCQLPLEKSNLLVWKCFCKISVSSNEVWACFLSHLIGFNVKTLTPLAWINPSKLFLYFDVGFPPDDDSVHDEPNQEKDKDENENQDKDEDIGIDNNKDEDKGIDKDKDEDKGAYVDMGTCI